MVERFEKFSYLISELSKLLHKIESEELAEFGVKGPYAIYLITLSKYPSGISATKIAELCARDKSDVSRAVSALIAKGLSVKIEEEGTKYRSPIRLTENGLRVAERISEKAAKAVDFASIGVSDKNRKIFYETLETICFNMTRMSRFGVPSKTENSLKHND